jgi:RNA-directed DNA polymerase
MHENRETSETPAVPTDGRSAGEGLGPHGPRARLRGVTQWRNTDEPFEQRHEIVGGEWGGKAADQGERWSIYHVSDTERERCVPRVGRRAESSKGPQGDEVHRLLHGLTVDLLRESFYSLKRKAAPGVDGVTWQEYESGLEDRLVDLHGRVHRGAYRALPSRRLYIQKEDGRQRPLGVAALENKIVQQAVVTILNQIYEEDSLGFSYGFRPGRG